MDPTIIYDHREEKSSIPAQLTLLGVDTISKQLVIGDYIISDKIAVERKSANDFDGSVINGRLFDQAYRLKQEYETPILIVEGESRLKKAAAQGAMVSVIKKGISIWRVKDYMETVEVLQRLAISEAKTSKPTIKGIRKKKGDPEHNAITAVAAIPGVSAEKSKKLLEHFGGIKNLVGADKKELLKVEGIGKKTAEDIEATFTYPFTEL